MTDCLSASSQFEALITFLCFVSPIIIVFSFIFPGRQFLQAVFSFVLFSHPDGFSEIRMTLRFPIKTYVGRMLEIAQIFGVEFSRKKCLEQKDSRKTEGIAAKHVWHNQKMSILMRKLLSLDIFVAHLFRNFVLSLFFSVGRAFGSKISHDT